MWRAVRIRLTAPFERIQADLDAIDEDDIPPFIYASRAAILREAVPALLATAKAEIAPAAIVQRSG